MYYRLLHSLYQKGNKTQSLCFDAKRRKCHRFLYFQFDFFFFCLIFLPYSTVHLPRKERHQDFWILMQSPQLSGRYSQTKTAPVRFYFTLVRRAIITNASVIIPFDVWWKKTKGNKLWQEHKEVWALCIANGNMKCLSLYKRLVFLHTQR